MRLGINLPWIHCGHDFGFRPPAWGGGERPERDWRGLRYELEACKNLGLKVVRVWVLAGGVNYPDGLNVLDNHQIGQLPAEHALRGAAPAGLRRKIVQLSGHAQHERVLLGGKPLRPLQPAFLEDFEQLLKVCEDVGIRLIPVLLSFEFFHPVDWQSGGVASRGRASFVFGDAGQDIQQIDRFLDTTLTPLLEVSVGYPGAIEAWEVINEPDWSTESGPVHLRLEGHRLRLMPKTVRKGAMSRFLSKSIDRIQDSGFLATVGFKHADPRWISADLRQRLIADGREGRYVHQVHHYPSLYEPGRLRPHHTLPIRPCWVGEMASIQGSPFGLHIAWWRERIADLHRAADREAFLRRRLEIVEALGYPVALLWSKRSPDIASDWNAIEAQVPAYLRDSFR